MEALFEWAISQEVTGVLQWLGTVLALVGFPLTVWQASKAAFAAAEAAKAVREFQWRVRSVSAAHAYSQLELAKGFVSSKNYTAASSVVGILKREVLQTATTLEREDAPKTLSQGRRNMALIESQLALAIRNDPTFKHRTLDGALRGLGECLIDWEHWIITQNPGAK
jgi:hypothetical protein